MNSRISIQSLKKFPIFETLSDKDLSNLLQVTHLRSIKQNEAIFIEGQAASMLYFVLEGWFKADKLAPDGRQHTLRFVGPGEIINELAVFSNEPNEVSVIAKENAQVFGIL